MRTEEQAFAIVIEHDEIRREIPDWPEHVMLATTMGLDGPDTRAIQDEASLRDFVGSRPVVPARNGFSLALPSFEDEQTALAATFSEAHILVDTGALPLPGAPLTEDRFSDVDDVAAAEDDLPVRYWMRRVRKGFEIRASTMPMFPWGIDRVAIGASTLGIHPSEQPLDRIMTFSVTDAAPGTLAAVTQFLPTRWQEVQLVTGAAGYYFDVSPLVLAELARRTKFSLFLSIAAVALAGIGATVFLLGLAAHL